MKGLVWISFPYAFSAGILTTNHAYTGKKGYRIIKNINFIGIIHHHEKNLSQVFMDHAYPYHRV